MFSLLKEAAMVNSIFFNDQGELKCSIVLKAGTVDIKQDIILKLKEIVEENELLKKVVDRLEQELKELKAIHAE